MCERAWFPALIRPSKALGRVFDYKEAIVLCNPVDGVIIRGRPKISTGIIPRSFRVEEFLQMGVYRFLDHQSFRRAYSDQCYTFPDQCPRKPASPEQRNDFPVAKSKGRCENSIARSDVMAISVRSKASVPLAQERQWLTPAYSAKTRSSSLISGQG